MIILSHLFTPTYLFNHQHLSPFLIGVDPTEPPVANALVTGDLLPASLLPDQLVSSTPFPDGTIRVGGIDFLLLVMDEILSAEDQDTDHI